MKTVVFDKTGTLTVGKPTVVSAVLFSNYSMEEFCTMATAAEVGVYILNILTRKFTLLKTFEYLKS